MRYGLNEQFDFVRTFEQSNIDKLSDIPDKFDFNCMLCITLQKFFTVD